MNNYMDMNYYMPNNYMYEGNIEDMLNQTAFLNNKLGLNQNNTKVFKTDTKLANKLKMQAGDNMNFNKSNYEQGINNMYDPYNGFIRGNMFKDLYNTYKLTKPYDIKPANEQAELLTYIDAYCFAAHDLNLYLDANPNDREAIDLFKNYTNQSQKFINQYEQKYGPLFVDGSLTYPWAWNESPWPWENK